MKSRVIHRVHTHRHAGIRCSVQCKLGDQRGVLGFAAYRRAVFAIQRDIKHTHTKLLLHLGLQLQAFAHALFNAAVVVADRQHHRTRLCALQHITRVLNRFGSGVQNG